MKLVKQLPDKFFDNQKKFGKLTESLNSLESIKDNIDSNINTIEFEFEAEEFDFKMLDGKIYFSLRSYDLINNIVSSIEEKMSYLQNENLRLIK